MNPLLTIVVPVYNREGLITRTLDSIASARQGTLSLMVVDNNSSDRTLAVCEEWAERHRSPAFRIDVLEELRPGAPAARNLGLRHVETPYVYFFDSDDLFSADFLTDMQGLLAAPSLSPDLLFVPVSMRDGSQLQTRDYKRSEKPSAQIATSMWCTQSMVFRTEWLRSIGGWDESLSIWQDWELGVRALLHRPQILWATEKSYHEILLHEASITGASASSRWTAALTTMQVVCREVREASSIDTKNQKLCLRALYLRALIHAGLLSRERCMEGSRAFTAFARKVMSAPPLSLRLCGWLLHRYTAMGCHGAWRVSSWMFA